MKVKFCTNCGFELGDMANFCPICGTKRAEIKVERKDVVIPNEKISDENDVAIKDAVKAKTKKEKSTATKKKTTKNSESSNEDIIVKCEECGAEIIYTAEQQAADIKESGFADAPKFCKDCKIKRMKAKKSSASANKTEEKTVEATKSTKSTKSKKSNETDNKDIVVKCEECGAEIIYTAEQQAADIKGSGFADAPKFCKDCRLKRMKSQKTKTSADKVIENKPLDMSNVTINRNPVTRPKKTSNSSKNSTTKLSVNKELQALAKEASLFSLVNGYYNYIVNLDEQIKTGRKNNVESHNEIDREIAQVKNEMAENLAAQQIQANSYNRIIALLGEPLLKMYPSSLSKNYSEADIQTLHKDIRLASIFGREKARKKAATAANQANNYRKEIIAELNKKYSALDSRLCPLHKKHEETDKKLNSEIKRITKAAKTKFSDATFINNNSALKKYYAVLYGDKNSATKLYGDEFFERNYVLMGKSKKRIPDVDAELIKVLNTVKSEFLYVDDSGKDVVFVFPEIDHLKDSNSIYYFRQQVVDDKNNSNAFGNMQQNVAMDTPKSNIYQVRNAIQSYIYQILQYSRYEDYEFVFCDPVSNGQSFGEMISLAHDDGYGVVNSIHCERNEISKALTQISNKIKDINEKIKGYDSIYEYNRKENDPLPTTVLVAFNFCDQYYEQDKIKPILENASKCGITVFFVESNNPTNKVEECRVALSAYEHNIFDFEKYENEEFDFITAPCDLDDWTSDYNDKKKSGVTINTNYSELGDLLPGFFSREATEGLHIPFAVDKRNGIVDFHLGVNMCYHAFVSGTTGIGKSVLLHSIITNVIRCYHPDDVELWLVDYKAVEFFDYVRFAPPHIKLVGLDRSWEFTKSFIDKIIEVAEERKRIIKDAGCKDINKYKKKYGARSMPHTVICIDEAHVLSQQIQQEPEYKEKFENILSEYRAFGVHIIMSDQAFSNSMAGITSKGKNQIGVRLAMKNSREEVNSTIEVDNQIMSGDEFRNTANSLSVGDVIYRWYEDSKTANAILHLDKVKALFSDPEREAVCIQAITLAKQQGYKAKNPWVVVGKERTSIFDVKNPFEDDKLEIGNDKRFNMFLGTPSSLDPYHMITVKRRKSANFIVVSDNDDISCSVAYFSAANMVRVADAKIFVIAPSATVDPNLRDALTESYGDRVVFAEDMESYNEALDEIKSTNEKVFVIWYGLDEIIDEMEMLDPPPREKNKARSSSFDMNFSDPFGTGKSAMDELTVAFGNSGDNEDNSSFGVKEYYDRTDEIVELLERGSASFKFSMVVLQNSKEILKRRDIKLSFFEHKFVYNVSEYRNVFETSCPIKIEGDLQKSSVVYYDGAEFSILRPYKIDEKTIEYFEE